MSDQMPDKVWCDRRFRNHPNFGDWDCGVDAGHYRSGARYIRADLYEQAEAERDRLRAALADIADDPYDYQRVQDKAQEALSHD